jgi:hypothetical protein
MVSDYMRIEQVCYPPCEGLSAKPANEARSQTSKRIIGVISPTGISLLTDFVITDDAKQRTTRIQWEMFACGYRRL